MCVLPIVIVSLLGAAPVKFQRHLIDNFPAGYQVAVADINGDGRPDVIALSTEADRVDWYEIRAGSGIRWRGPPRTSTWPCGTSTVTAGR